MSSTVIPLSKMVKEATAVDVQAFLARYNTPYLLVDLVKVEQDDARAFQTVHIAVPLGGPGEGTGEEADEPMLYPVCKEGMADATLVTIGRTRTSDICLDSPAVSKMHAYFARDPISGEYTLADAGSTNGTVVAGTRLSKNEPMALKGGEVLEIAGRFQATYLPPKMLYAFLVRVRPR